jgi:phospholipase C
MKSFELILCLGLAGVASAYPIKHVVTLMLENRAYDHMVGAIGLPGQTGVNGSITNPLNVSNPGQGVLPYAAMAPYEVQVRERWVGLPIAPPRVRSWSVDAMITWLVPWHTVWHACVRMQEAQGEQGGRRISEEHAAELCASLCSMA